MPKTARTPMNFWNPSPPNPVDHAEAIAKKGGYSGTTLPEFYTNDDEDRTVDAGGIQLLDDGLLLQGDDSRQELMEQKAEEKLGAPGEGRTYKYDFHYLDHGRCLQRQRLGLAEYGTHGLSALSGRSYSRYS